MVDLMMWLVIAALLLAAALQGIGYYQKSATLYAMKNDATHAAEAVMARMASTDGITTDTVGTTATDESAKTRDVTTVYEAGSSDADGFVIRSSSDSVDTDVLFLSKQRGEWSPGIHVVPDGTVIDSNGTTTVVAPTTDPADINGDGIPNTSDPDIDGDGIPNSSDSDIDDDGIPNGTDTTPNGELTPVVQPTIDTSNVMTTVWDTRLSTDANFNTMNYETVSMVPCATISVPLAQAVDATIDWGDGSPVQTVKSAYNSTSISHTYTGTPGLRTVTITGHFDAWVGWDWINWTQGCITEVTSWGDGTGTFDGTVAFNGAKNLTDIARIPLTLTNLDNFAATLSSTFTGASFSKWDVSNVTNMAGAFADNSNLTGDMSNWNVSNVERFNNTFAGTTFSSDISKWDVSKAYTFTFMFYMSTFNGDISNWNTSGAERMSFMFADSTFNGDLSRWNVSAVTEMGRMFDNSPFSGDISNWNVSNVNNFGGMFQNTSYNGDLSRWNTGNATMTSFMFANSTFNGDISNWDLSKVTNTGAMFQGNKVFNRDISRWNTSNVTEMMQMFEGASAFNQNISGWNVAKVNSRYNFSTGSGLTAGNLPAFK